MLTNLVCFTVDLFNEGVDLPYVDTIVVLRTAQSATVFRQQLGQASATGCPRTLRDLPIPARIEGEGRRPGRPPYLYGGTMQYLNHTGERPLRIRWRLDQQLPADIFRAAQLAAG